MRKFENSPNEGSGAFRSVYKAFTLVEMIVVLALTGLVVAIIFYVWYTLELFGNDYRESNTRAAALTRMHYALRLDAKHSAYVTTQDGSFRFFQEDSTLYTTWSTSPEGSVRQDRMGIDSFHVAGVSLYLPGNGYQYKMYLLPGDSSLPDSLVYSINRVAKARDPDY